MTRLLLTLPLVAAIGCAHSTQVRKETSPRGDATAAAAAPKAAENSCSSDGECRSGQLCRDGRCVDVSGDAPECAGARVHFALDSSAIDSSERSEIERSARCLRADHALLAAVDGNTDERGTEEYNMALGDQRAKAVATLLRSYGVDDNRVKTVSYGKEKPLCDQHEETCWAQNRRAAMVLQPGSQTTPSTRPKHKR